MTRLRPLGVFGPKQRENFNLSAADLVPLFNAIDESVRAEVAAYLRSGVVVLALMEYTTDVIAGAFGVPGGSGILTDGRYYWRLDAADYVEHYGIALDPTAIEWMESNGWRTPRLSSADVVRFDSELYELFRPR